MAAGGRPAAGKAHRAARLARRRLRRFSAREPHGRVRSTRGRMAMVSASACGRKTQPRAQQACGRAAHGCSRSAAHSGTPSFGTSRSERDRSARVVTRADPHSEHLCYMVRLALFAVPFAPARARAAAHLHARDGKLRARCTHANEDGRRAVLTIIMRRSIGDTYVDGYVDATDGSALVADHSHGKFPRAACARCSLRPRVSSVVHQTLRPQRTTQSSVTEFVHA